MYETTGGLAVVGSPPSQKFDLNRIRSMSATSSSSLQPSDRQPRRSLFEADESSPTRGVHGQPRRDPFIIGVAGGTASGKTTVCNQIVNKLHDQRVALISMDSFYRGLSPAEKANVGEYNFDHPNAFDADEIVNCLELLRSGQPVEVPTYCFCTHQRLPETRRVNPSDVVIIEGILLFQFQEIVDGLNMKIFVDTDDDVRLARRIQRDTVERARDVSGVIDQYTKFVKPMFEQFVLPSKKVADIIIPWARGDNVVAIDLIVQHILTKLGQHDLRRIFPNLDVLPGNYQTRGMHTLIRNASASKSDFVFYSNRLIRLVVEHSLGQLPFTERIVTTPTGGVYVGVGFCEGLCGVSIIRSGEAMENALRDCCKGIKIGKILIHRPSRKGVIATPMPLRVDVPNADSPISAPVEMPAPFQTQQRRKTEMSFGSWQGSNPLEGSAGEHVSMEEGLAEAMGSIELSDPLPEPITRAPTFSVPAPTSLVRNLRHSEVSSTIIYEKLPADIARRNVLLLDPILATGSSATEAIKILLERGVAAKRIILCTLIAAPPGIQSICSSFPEVRVITSEIDWGLDDEGQVLPGIGEFGDRYFGTD